MLLVSPAQHAAEQAGAGAAGAAAAPYQQARPHDRFRGEDPRGQGGSSAYVRTNALTQSILAEALSNARGAAAHDAPHGGALGQRQLASLALGGARPTEHPLISRQVRYPHPRGGHCCVCMDGFSVCMHATPLSRLRCVVAVNLTWYRERRLLELFYLTSIK